MNNRNLLASTLLCASLLPALAHADIACGAETHARFDETRAFFTDALGACSEERGCSVVITNVSGNDSVAWDSQMRIRPTDQGGYRVSMGATTPMPSSEPVGMRLNFANSSFWFDSPTMWENEASNEFELTHPATNSALVTLLKSGKDVEWVYPTLNESEHGAHKTSFSLRGVTKALNWIGCMAQRSGE